MNQTYITALYLRISDEDEERNNSNESESIAGQRLILTEFIKGHKELSDGRSIEVVDDGLSGTNFERPGIKRLLELAKAHEVNCIIVKDFSRFGRNYLEVGHYLEQIFPFLGIRFISVSDQFDSFAGIGAAGSIEVGFKNIIYEAYSKDLSEKIRSIRRLKAEQGKFVTAFAPYGYRKAQENKNQLVIDAACASIVRRIFDLYLGGMGKTAIARLLNKETIPSPLLVRKQRQENFRLLTCKEQSHWTTSTVSQILSDQRYVGDAVYGKVAPQKVGSKKDVQVPRADWIVVSDAHPSIVERERFEMVQADKKTHAYKRTGEEKALAAKVLCRACNHALKRICKGKQVYFQCTTHRNTDAYPCFPGNMPESALETAILTYLQTLAQSAQDRCNAVGKSNQSLSASISKELKAVEDKIARKKRNSLAWYQAFKAGNMGEAAYTKQSVVIEMELAMLQEQVVQYEQAYHRAILEQPSIASADMARLQDYAPFNQLTKDLVDAFVKAVYLETDGSMSISWSFSDPFSVR